MDATDSRRRRAEETLAGNLSNGSDPTSRLSHLREQHMNHSQNGRQGENLMPADVAYSPASGQIHSQNLHNAANREPLRRNTPNSAAFDTLTQNDLHLDTPLPSRETPSSSTPGHESCEHLYDLIPRIDTRIQTPPRFTRPSPDTQVSPPRNIPYSLSTPFVDLTDDSAMPKAKQARSGKRASGDASQGPSSSSKRQRVDSPKDEVEEVDLRDVNTDSDLARVLERQRAATVKAQQDEADKPTKLAGITCVVCMEELTNATVTHCGHIFCHTCLMECLIAGEIQDGKGQSKCPMCRKVVKRPTEDRHSTHVIPLEIKVGSRRK